MTSFQASTGRHCHNAVSPLHSAVYFAPERQDELAALGLERGAMSYYAGRAAPLGAVGAGTVTATFYNFNHEHVKRYIPAVWTVTTPEAVLAAVLRGVDAMLRRLLGAEVLASKEMAEAAGLALRATEACHREARPLYAAHAGLPVPEEPHLALWHAATLLREHRGDGHLAALAIAGLSGVEALVLHNATGTAPTSALFMRTRGGPRSSGTLPGSSCASAACWTKQGTSSRRARPCAARPRCSPTASTPPRTTTSARLPQHA